MIYGIGTIPAGLVGTDATIKVIGRFVAESLERPYIRIVAIQILDRSGADSHNRLEAARAIHFWVRENIAYINDPIDVETVQEPEITLKLKAGDCDDHVALIAALMGSVGISSRFVAIGTDKENLSHIFTEVLIGSRWLGADSTISEPFGYSPALPVRFYYTYKGDRTMNGLAQIGQATQVLPVRVGEVQNVAYRTTLRVLKSNWDQGLINLDDVDSYMRVIDEGNSPSYGTILEGAMRQGVEDFRSSVAGLPAMKPGGALSGLEGLDGFLSSIWGGVKKAVGAVVGIVTGGVSDVIGGSVKSLVGGGRGEVTVQPAVVRPVIPTAAALETVGIAAKTIFQNPIFLVGLGFVAILLLKGKR